MCSIEEITNIARINPYVLNWFIVSTNYGLTESFINEFSGFLNWTQVCRYQILTNECIKRNIDKIHWYFTIKHQTLSEQLLRDVSNVFEKSDWSAIKQYQNLSDAFKHDFKEQLCID